MIKPMHKLKAVVLALLFCFMFTLPVLAAPTVMLDGQQINFEVQPTIEDGRTLVPLRAIFEAMGATVKWDGATKTASAVKGETTVVLPVGSLQPTINGQVKQLEIPAKIIDGRTLAPLRFVGEAFGGTVGWDGTTQTIAITTSTGEQIKVHFIDVGQADSIYIQLPEHNDILIDGGNRADGPAVVNYLKSQGVDDIELMICTHPHEDHIGGLPDVLDAFVVEKILDSGKTTDTAIYNKYAAEAAAEGAIWQADNNRTYSFGNAVLQVLTGPETWGDNLNNYSVVCRLDTGDIEFLFTGDAEAEEEAFLKGELDSEILKVCHHGSDSSSTVSFLDKVKPEVAIISCGTGNKYGHPSPETLTKLQNVGAKTYRTDLNGTIIVTTDGKTYSVTSQKNLQAPETNIIPPAGRPPVITAPTTKGKYVGSTKSNKYHHPDCRYAKKISPENQIWFKDKAAAEAAGYVPCGWCKP